MKWITGLAVGLALLLAGCDETETLAEAPPPQELTRDAIGYYCNMIVADHHGPKAQIHRRGQDEPTWFSSVRDAVAYTMLPEEPKSISAIYVNDMGAASWESPEPETWVAASEAVYVIRSDRVGGMGAPETVPFATEAGARAFIAQHGGEIVRWGDIPQDYVLGPVEEAAVPRHDDGHGEHTE